MKRRYKVGLFFFGICTSIICLAYYPKIVNYNYSFKWEGLIPGKLNFRDTFESINSCLGRNTLPEGILFRSNEYFSGWSCSKINDPNVILSLNYNDADKEEFYCRNGSRLQSSEHFQSKELNDLEFLSTWKNDIEQVKSTCQFLDRAIQALPNQKILVHCEAGRDRTGAVSALLASLYWEKTQDAVTTPELIGALECDYRKSASLNPSKYGRIQNFLTEIIETYGSTSKFYDFYCHANQSQK